MANLTAQRTLVKSPPELWSELSEVESLARHLGELGEIRITKVEPETTVAWEGEQISGTVQLEESGWGTKVTFHATVPEPDVVPAAEPNAIADPLQPAPAEPAPGAPEPIVPAPVDPEPIVEPEPLVAVEPEAAEIEVVAEPRLVEHSRRKGFWAQWLFRQRRPAAVEPVPIAPVSEPDTVEIDAVVAQSQVVPAEPEPVATEPEPVAVEPERKPVAAEHAPPVDAEVATSSAIEPDRVQAVLDGTLEALGQAHHRPFSRG